MPKQFQVKGLARKLLLLAADMGLLVVSYYIAILLLCPKLQLASSTGPMRSAV